METNDALQYSMKAELDVLSRSDGSALLSQGKSTILAAVSGPIEARVQNFNQENATIDVVYRSKSGLSSVQDRFIENFVQQVCNSLVLTTSYSRSSRITVQLQEMERHSGLLACCTNATILALMNSGIDCRFLVAAVSCALSENGEMVLDPSEKQLKDAVASFTLAFDSLNRKVVAVHAVGKYSKAQYGQVVEKCREASETIFNFYRDVVEKFSVVL